MMTHQAIGLTPRLVPFLGVLFNIAVRYFSKGPSPTRGSLLGRRVLATDHLEHQFGRQLAGVRKGNGIGSANMEPTRAIVEPVDQLVGAVSAGLYLQCQS